MCFSVRVSQNCIPQNLSIQVAAAADGVWGSYTSTQCDNVNYVNIYTGTSSATPVVLGAISHN
jgi:hypothetical protein